MSNKTKTIETPLLDRVQEISSHAGLVLMAAAATVGMVELPEHFNSRVTTAAQPAFAFVDERAAEQNAQRREREETGPHYISYSVAQRTPGRSGRS